MRDIIDVCNEIEQEVIEQMRVEEATRQIEERDERRAERAALRAARYVPGRAPEPVNPIQPNTAEARYWARRNAELYPRKSMRVQLDLNDVISDIFGP